MGSRQPVAGNEFLRDGGVHDGSHGPCRGEACVRAAHVNRRRLHLKMVVEVAVVALWGMDQRQPAADSDCLLDAHAHVYVRVVRCGVNDHRSLIPNVLWIQGYTYKQN